MTELKNVKKIRTDILIVGSGAAGLYCALKLPKEKQIVIITKEDAESSDSFLAQGGMCVLKSEDDYDSYFEDTMRVGHYKNRKESVDIMIRSSQNIVKELIGYGVEFEQENGKLLYTREGGHSTHRIVFHEDITGKEITSKLLAAVKKCENVKLLEYTTMIDLLTDGKTCAGAVTVDKAGTKQVIEAEDTVLACGGLGGLYEHSTNFRHLTGDALAIALSHDIQLENIDYIQIHPTTLYSKKPGRRFLISESVRGEGAILLDKNGNRFVNELQPRDVVAAAVLAQPTGKAWLLIDDKLVKSNKLAAGYVSQGLMVSGKNVDELAKAMGVPAKNLKATMDQYQKAFETKKDEAFGRPEMVVANNVWPMYAVQITPAIHHTMGGVRINKNAEVIGVTAKPIPGLYAAGEVTGGVHGGNRIGGNAVADIITFGRIAGANAANYMTK